VVLPRNVHAVRPDPAYVNQYKKKKDQKAVAGRQGAPIHPALWQNS
jgi:hypothetical protein